MYVPMPVVIVAGIVMLAMALALLRRSAGRGDLTRPPPMPAQIPPMPADLPARVRAMVGERRKIEAVKLVRETTGLGLKEAKDLVEAIAEGRAG